MIDAKELRAGNFVWWNDKVYCIAQNLECLAVMPDLYPIQLDEDWFIKLGFENTDWGFGKTGVYRKLGFEIAQAGDDFIENVYTVRIDGCFYVKLQHVHRLQNLFYEIRREELIALKF